MHFEIIGEITNADPSFKNTQIGEILEELCAGYDILLDWHPGFTLSVDNIFNIFEAMK